MATWPDLVVRLGRWCWQRGRVLRRRFLHWDLFRRGYEAETVRQEQAALQAQIKTYMMAKKAGLKVRRMNGASIAILVADGRQDTPRQLPGPKRHRAHGNGDG
jgi:hypothetical protein